MAQSQNSLKLKVVIFLALALTLAMAMFTWLVIQHQRKELLDAAVNHVTQVSELITRSTRYAMLQNQPDYVLRIIQDVGKQENIEKIRVLSKDGTIIHSSYLPEIGRKVDRKADACVFCHQGEKPLEQVPASDRSRIYTNAVGERVLGSMEVIRNEPSCSNAACHEHKASLSVLGVLDIVYSLKEIDRTIRTSTMTIIGLFIGFIVIVSLSVSVLVHRLLYLPLGDLEAGAKRISAGNLEEPIPVRSADELGHLASSFNAMTVALRDSQHELREWGHTLELKVERRTQQLRNAEAETVRSEKLASVGLLAAGIAHELNNPLTGVLTFSHLLREKMPEGSQDAEDLDLIIRETKRCAAIIRRLLDFAREKPPEKTFADLNQVIQETQRIVERPASFHDVTIAMDLDPNLPPVWFDAHQIKQVIMNILVNAQHAIEQNGSIVIRSRLLSQPRSPEPGMAPVPMAEISISDNGCGIPEKNLQRIFDPFFTSKEVGKGTGLGLSVSHGIVKAHGGSIEVESTVGEGSTFHVYLPIAPGPESTIRERKDA